MNLKHSLASNVSNPIPEDVLMNKKVKKGFIMLLIVLLLDLVISLIFNLLNIIFLNEKTLRNKLILVFIFLFIFYIFFIIMFYIKKSNILYFLIFGFCLLIFTIFEFYYQIKIMKNTDKYMKDRYINYNLDVFILISIIVSVVVRFVIIYCLKSYKLKLFKLENFQRLIEHENFVEKIENRVDKSNRWSEASKKTNSYLYNSSAEINESKGNNNYINESK
jgi:hypothetical protein